MKKRSVLRNFILLAGSLVVLLTAVNLSQAQDIDADAYRAQKQNAVDVFFDKGQPTERRLAVVPQLGYPTKDIAERLFQVGKDKTEADAIRLAAMKKHRYTENWLTLMLATIADPSESDELASGLIRDVSQRTTFKQPVETLQQIRATLRARLDDSRPQTRLEAFRTLVASQDQQAVDKVVSSLRANTPVVPIVDAIQLLDLDGASKHILTLRPFLEHDNINVRAEAARALTVDPQSQPQIVQWVTDSTMNKNLRLKAMRGLAREDELFISYGMKLALNPNEHADIRYAALENSMRRLNYQGASAREQIAFAQVVERLTSVRGAVTSSGKDLGAEAKQLLAHLRQNFPAIKRHYRLKQFTGGPG